MRERGLVVVLAFLLAIGATAGVFLYVQGVRNNAGAGSLVNVVVAKQDVVAGTDLNPLLDQGAFETKGVPEGNLVQGAVTSLDQLSDHVTAEPIFAGEQIPITRVTGQAVGGQLGIPKGYEAETLTVSGDQAVAGFVNTGDHLALYATFSNLSGVSVVNGNIRVTKTSVQASNVTTASGGAITVDLIPDVRVLDVQRPSGATPTTGTSSSSDSSSTTTGSGVNSGTQFLVTLAVKPLDGQRLAYAIDQASSIQVALMPPGQTGAAQKPATVAEVLK